MVMDALSRAKIPVSFLDWEYIPQLQEWQLLIASPWVDTKGPLTAYRALVEALKAPLFTTRCPCEGSF